VSTTSILNDLNLDEVPDCDDITLKYIKDLFTSSDIQELQTNFVDTMSELVNNFLN